MKRTNFYSAILLTSLFYANAMNSGFSISFTEHRNSLYHTQNTSGVQSQILPKSRHECNLENKNKGLINKIYLQNQRINTLLQEISTLEESITQFSDEVINSFNLDQNFIKNNDQITNTSKNIDNLMQYTNKPQDDVLKNTDNAALTTFKNGQDKIIKNLNTKKQLLKDKKNTLTARKNFLNKKKEKSQSKQAILNPRKTQLPTQKQTNRPSVPVARKTTILRMPTQNYENTRITELERKIQSLTKELEIREQKISELENILLQKNQEINLSQMHQINSSLNKNQVLNTSEIGNTLINLGQMMLSENPLDWHLNDSMEINQKFPE